MKMNNAIGLICSVLMSQLTAPAFAAPPPDDLSRCFQRLAERQADSPSETAIAELVNHGTESLSFLYEEFGNIDHMARYWFRTKVVPKLPPAETSNLLLADFRLGIPVVDEFHQLLARAEKEGETPAIKAAYTKIEGRYQRLRWTTGAIGNLGYSNGYDTVYPVYLQHTSIRNMHHDLVRALYGNDPARAMKDFTSLVRSPDDVLRLKGVSSFRQIGQLPPCSLVARLIDDPADTVRREAGQLVYRVELDCLDLLIELSDHKDNNVRRSAEMRLRFLSHIPEAHVKEMMAASRATAAPSDVWRKWWQRVRRLSEEDRRRQGMMMGLKLAEDHLDAKLVSFLSGFPEYAEVYPIMTRALDDSDPSLKKAGLGAISRMAWTGEDRAVSFLLDYCTRCPIENSIFQLKTLRKIDDSRTVSVLLQMLAKDFDGNETWPAQVLDAIGRTGDKCAIDAVTRWLSEHEDGSQHAAAKALAELAGPNAVQPLLLQRLVQGANQNTRYYLRNTIESIGGYALAGDLLRMLPDADAGDQHRAGPQKDVLLLMEAFPDPAAKPMLQALLKTDNRFSRLYAARVLGKLGDYTGVPIILKDLFTKEPVPYHFHAHDIGQALKDIGGPGTRARLETLYQRVEGEDRGRVINVIGQQENPAFLPFLDRLVNDSTEPPEVCGAAGAIGRLIYSLHKDKPRQPMEITATNLAAAKLMLRLAFHGEKLREYDGGFPDHALLAKMQGAVLKAGEYAYLHYKIEDGSLRELSMQNPDDAKLIAQAKPRSEDTFAYGSVHWMVYADFMSLGVHIDYGGSSYLFQMKKGEWTPICSLGGAIE